MTSEWKEILHQSALCDQLADSLVLTHGARPVGQVNTIIGNLRDIGGQKMEMRVIWKAVDENSEYAYTVKESSK